MEAAMAENKRVEPLDTADPFQSTSSTRDSTNVLPHQADDELPWWKHFMRDTIAEAAALQACTPAAKVE
jgi:hypothetical protein